MFYIYILYSSAFDRFYIGYSNDPWRRLTEHNTSELNSFTSKFRPWIISAVFEAGSKNDAIKMEKLIKRQKSKKLILKLVDPNFIPNRGLAQLVRVPHLRD